MPGRVCVGAGDGAMIGGMTWGDGAIVPGANAPPTLKVKEIDTTVVPPPTLSCVNACAIFLHKCKERIGQTILGRIDMSILGQLDNMNPK